ncbi:hypothetical protein QBC36DRAFT_333795, partial [Triangularia setosa]
MEPSYGVLPPGPGHAYMPASVASCRSTSNPRVPAFFVSRHSQPLSAPISSLAWDTSAPLIHSMALARPPRCQYDIPHDTSLTSSCLAYTSSAFSPNQNPQHQALKATHNTTPHLASRRASSKTNNCQTSCICAYCPVPANRFPALRRRHVDMFINISTSPSQTVRREPPTNQKEATRRLTKRDPSTFSIVSYPRSSWPSM